MIYAMCAAQGPRPYMEDTYSVNSTKQYTLFGVYDGHNGKDVSDMLAKQTNNVLGASLKQNTDLDLHSVMRSLFLKLDAMSCSHNGHESGSTMSIALVTRSKVWFANCGDSLVMVGLKYKKASKPWAMVSQEHKAETEVERITAKGGKVINVMGVPRVQGYLNMSRSIGDHHLSPFVIPDPFITYMNKEQIEYILIASDGVWDVFNMDEMHALIEQLQKTHGYKQHLSQQERHDILKNVLGDIVTESYKRGSMDNITILYIDMI